MKAKEIVNTQDERLYVTGMDEQGRIVLDVEIGEPNHLGSAAATIKLTKARARKLIKAVQGLLDAP